jgi:amidase
MTHASDDRIGGPGPAAPELVGLAAGTLAAQVAAGVVSCVEVMRAHLDHIEVMNPAVTAVVGLRGRESLLAEAGERDAELRSRGPRGPLHGLPVAVKDLAEAAGLPWTSGSPLYAERVGVTDEPFVARMRAAGAIVIGKTNVPELGLGSQSYNPVWGTTRNPYDVSRTAGGSSGGAAAALALRMLPIADGSDYMGSLRNPAAFCNVLGFRPSRGRVPRPGFEVDSRPAATNAWCRRSLWSSARESTNVRNGSDQPHFNRGQFTGHMGLWLPETGRFIDHSVHQFQVGLDRVIECNDYSSVS